jgi:hypothetical protein
MHLVYHILLLIIYFDIFVHCRGGRGGGGGDDRVSFGRVGGDGGKYLYFLILNFVSF